MGFRQVTHPRDIVPGWYIYIYVKNPKFNARGEWIGGRPPDHWPGGLPLYLGKGIDARAFQHRYAAERVNRGGSSNQAFTYKLAKMLRDKTKYGIFVLLEKLTEADAYARERDLIEAIGRNNIDRGPLYNLVDGGGGITSERARDLVNSPKRLARLREALADPGYRAKHRARIAKEDSKQRELRRQWGRQGALKAAAIRRVARDAMTEQEKQGEQQARLERRRAKARESWEKRKNRANEQRRMHYRERGGWAETKQAKARKTPEGRLKRNAAERERRRRKRLRVLGLLGEQ